MRGKRVNKALAAAFGMVTVLMLSACSGKEPAGQTASAPAGEENVSAGEENASAGEENKAPEGEKLVIGMAMNEEIDYVNELQNALQELADKENIEMIFTNANGSAEKQLSDIDSLIVQKPDVIVIRVVDPDSGVSCVEAVKNAGIPCVIQDTLVNTDIYDCRIVGDQAMVGQLIGSYMQEWLDEDESRTINMGYINGGASDVIKKRETGIYDVVDPARINTFSSQIATGFSAEEAMTFAEDWLQSQPDMNCIACANDEMAAACIQALNGAGIDHENFLVFGCDGGTIGQQYLESGEMDATVSQSVTKVAEAILQVSRDLTDGKEYENKIYDPQCFELMTKDNMAEVLGNK